MKPSELFQIHAALHSAHALIIRDSELRTECEADKKRRSVILENILESISVIEES